MVTFEGVFGENTNNGMQNSLNDAFQKAITGQLSPDALKTSLTNPSGDASRYFKDAEGKIWQMIGDLAGTCLLLPDDSRNSHLVPPAALLPLSSSLNEYLNR